MVNFTRARNYKTQSMYSSLKCYSWWFNYKYYSTTQSVKSDWKDQAEINSSDNFHYWHILPKQRYCRHGVWKPLISSILAQRVGFDITNSLLRITGIITDFAFVITNLTSSDQNQRDMGQSDKMRMFSLKISEDSLIIDKVSSLI